MFSKNTTKNHQNISQKDTFLNVTKAPQGPVTHHAFVSQTWTGASSHG